MAFFRIYGNLLFSITSFARNLEFGLKLEGGHHVDSGVKCFKIFHGTLCSTTNTHFDGKSYDGDGGEDSLRRTW